MTPQLPSDAVLLVVDVQRGMDRYVEQYFSTVVDTKTLLAAL